MICFLMFVRPCKLMISYVYIKYVLELQNVANGDFFENEISCKYSCFRIEKYLQLNILMLLYAF